MSDPTPAPVGREPSRWRGVLQHARDPLFLLNQHRRILVVNRAWENLLGVSFDEARKLPCSRRASAAPGHWDPFGRALCPPPEVFENRPARVRRQVLGPGSARQWWDVDFFPFTDGKGRLRVLGRITVCAVEREGRAAPLPERLQTLRERHDQRYRLELFSSELPALRRVAEQVRLAAAGRSPVLIAGAAGTGKQWLARTIHHHGPQPERGFACLDGTRLPPDLLAPVLFGERGLLQPAGPVTLYLREPARLPRDVQERLCDWLEERPADAPRLLAGSVADLAAEVAAGRVLERLYFALSPLVIALPPLSERRADLPLLVERLLERANADGEKRVTGLAPAAWDVVRAYAWPGNLRELFAVLLSAREHAAGERIEAADLPAALRLAVNLDPGPRAAPTRAVALDQVLEEVERRLLTLALKKAQGNKSRAAELLSIWRPRLLRRLEYFNVSGD